MAGGMRRQSDGRWRPGDRIRPISGCKFCCVPAEERGASFDQHPRCGACSILMGPGHIENDAEAEYCSTCARTRQKAEARIA